jgi:hypothetical protein
MNDGAVETIREALDRARLDLSHPARRALHALESQNQALQERAERAERKLRDWLEFHSRYHTPDELFVMAEQTRQLLSPTQETDPG